MRVFSLVIIFFLLLIPISQAQEQLILQNYTMDDGLYNFWVTNAVQDRFGFMWFSTDDELTRFDGYTFNTYPTVQSDGSPVQSNRIWLMDIDDQGTLWIARIFQPLESFDPVSGDYNTYPSSSNNLPNDSFGEVYCDNDLVWLGHGYGGGLSSLNRATGEIKNYRIEEESLIAGNKDNLHRLNAVWDVHRDQDGDLWVGTEFGLYRFDQANDSFSRYAIENEDIDNESRTLYDNIIDLSPVKLLVETADGPMEFDKTTGKFYPILPYNLDNNYYVGYNCFAIVERGNAWIANPEKDDTYLEIFNYQPDSKSLKQYNASGRPLYLDRSGNMWLDVKYGVSSVSLMGNNINTYRYNLENTASAEVTASMIDVNGFLWVGTKAGLFKLGNKDQQREVIVDFTNKIGSIEITRIFQARDQTIWLGTSNGLYRYFPDSQKFKKYQINNTKPCTQETPDFQSSIGDIYQGRDGTIWFGGWCGLAKFTGDDHPIKYYWTSGNKRLENFQQDQFGTLWFTSDYFEIMAFDSRTEQFHPFSVPTGALMNCLRVDQSGILWIGTNSGLYSLKLQPLDSLLDRDIEITSQYHLYPHNYVADIKVHKDQLWILNPIGLAQLNLTTHELQIFDKNEGFYKIPWGGYLSASLDSGGNIYYFWNDRFSIFHPDSIRYNQYQPPVVLTDFQISNKSINIGDSLEGKPMLTRAIHDTESITLPTGQTFSLEFAALDYTNPKKNLYSYMLDGLDEVWSPPGKQRIATYTNLWEGDYTFRVKGSNNDGVWNEEGTSIKITILPPWYRSKLAYGLYGGLLILALVISRKFIVNREREKAQAQLKLLELEKAKEVDQAKTRFFANISHEFRTPLTLIMGPIKQMYEGTFTGDTKTVFGVIIRNAQRLLQLVNQLLDFSRLEAGNSTLQASPSDMVEFLRTMFSTFESTAQQHKIRYMFQSSVSSLQVYFDRDKLEKVIINLLGNAFKFTGKGESINLKLIREENGSPVNTGEGTVEIIVEDTGKGIAADKLPYIFDRFYQADDSYTREQEGTGLGLALAKELVGLHHGNISVTSKKGEGTTFTIHLPLGKAHLTEAEIAEVAVYGPKHHKTVTTILPEPGSSLPKSNGNEDLPLILIVEDNEDMRLYIREMLSSEYNLLEAWNGVVGQEQALEHTPDLIISDVMMPDMDGHQLCQKLKSDERTSHIPVVLLTARAGEEAKLEGLETGADDYLTKPFSSAELKTRIQNLIELRKKLREKFEKNLSLTEQDVQVSSIDQRFLEKAFEILETHRSLPEFNSDIFAREIGMSRSQLHRKLKALTGYSTGEFIRTYRLNYAKDLINKNYGDIAQISYESGFSSPSYFTECFKKHFGVVPSQFGKQEPES